MPPGRPPLWRQFVLWLIIPALITPLWMSFGRLFVGVGGWLTIMLMMFVLPLGTILVGVAAFFILKRAGRVRPMAIGRTAAWPLVIYLPCAILAPLTVGDYGDTADSAVLAPLQVWGLSEPVVGGLAAVSWIGALGGLIALLICSIIDFQDWKHL